MYIDCTARRVAKAIHGSLLQTQTHTDGRRYRSCNHGSPAACRIIVADHKLLLQAGTLRGSMYALFLPTACCLSRQGQDLDVHSPYKSEGLFSPCTARLPLTALADGQTCDTSRSTDNQGRCQFPLSLGGQQSTAIIIGVDSRPRPPLPAYVGRGVVGGLSRRASAPRLGRAVADLCPNRPHKLAGRWPTAVEQLNSLWRCQVLG